MEWIHTSTYTSHTNSPCQVLGCLRDCHASDLQGSLTFLLALKQLSHGSLKDAGSSPYQTQHPSSESHLPSSLTSCHTKGSHVYCLHFPPINILSEHVCSPTTCSVPQTIAGPPFTMTNQLLVIAIQTRPQGGYWTPSNNSSICTELLVPPLS